MPDFLNLPPWTNCVPLYLRGHWWLCSDDVAVVLGISRGSVSVRHSSGVTLNNCRSICFHGLRLWLADDINDIFVSRSKCCMSA